MSIIIDGALLRSKLRRYNYLQLAFFSFLELTMNVVLRALAKTNTNFLGKTKALIIVPVRDYGRNGHYLSALNTL